MCFAHLINHSRICAAPVLTLALLVSLPRVVPDIAAQEGPPTVDKVIELHRSGVSEAILVAWIRQAQAPLRLTTDELLKLASAKVPDRVVQALMDPATNLQAPTPTIAQAGPSVILSPTGVPLAVPTTLRPSGATTDDRTAAGDPDDPGSPHDSGIYFYQLLPTVKMILLEPTAYTGANTNALLNSLVSSLIPKVTRASIPGNEASVRVNETSPTFYFYFEDRAAGLGKAGLFGGISSPNQFVLVKLERKKNTREASIQRESALGGSSGTNQKNAVAFKSQRLKAGLYKVSFPQPLATGEFAFMVSSGLSGAQQAGAASPMQIFDFGVDIVK